MPHFQSDLSFFRRSPLREIHQRFRPSRAVPFRLSLINESQWVFFFSALVENCLCVATFTLSFRAASAAPSPYSSAPSPNTKFSARATDKQQLKYRAFPEDFRHRRPLPFRKYASTPISSFEFCCLSRRPRPCLPTSWRLSCSGRTPRCAEITPGPEAPRMTVLGSSQIALETPSFHRHHRCLR